MRNSDKNNSLDKVSNKVELEFKKFIELIKDKRKEAKLSQSEMAAKLGIAQTQYKRIEDGSTLMSKNLKTFLEICDVLSIDFNPNGKSLVSMSADDVEEMRKQMRAQSEELEEMKSKMGDMLELMKKLEAHIVKTLK